MQKDEKDISPLSHKLPAFALFPSKQTLSILFTGGERIAQVLLSNHFSRLSAGRLKHRFVGGTNFLVWKEKGLELFRFGHNGALHIVCTAAWRCACRGPEVVESSFIDVYVV